MMKVTRFVAMLIVLLAQSSSGIDKVPDQTLLWNRFVEVLTFDKFVLALGEHGITLFEWNDNTLTYLEKSHVVLPSQALTMKLEGLVIVVRLIDGTLIFINFERIDNLSILGELKPSFDYSDFALYEDQLYLSRWFDGIGRYRVTDFGELTFIENIRPGVVITQLHVETRFLFALDRYNGVIQYDLKAGFENSPKRLLLNERPFAMNVWGPYVFISMSSLGVVVGNFAGDTAFVETTIANLPSPKKVIDALGYLAFLSNRQVSIRQGRTFEEIASINLESDIDGGSVSFVGGKRYLLFPNPNGGISSIELLDVTNKKEVLHRPGPIASIFVHGDNLFTGGGGNPLEMYALAGDSLHSPELLRRELTGVFDLAQSGNLLYALYADEKKVLVFDMADLIGVPEVLDSLSISIDDACQLLVHDSLLLIIGRNQIEALSEEFGEVVWGFDKPIVEAEIQNEMLFITNRFGGLAAYTIHDDLSLFKCAERDLTGTGWAMEIHDNHLFVFTGNTLTTFNNCLELDTIVHLPFYVLDAEIRNDTLFTIGPDGIAKYDLSDESPAFIESGGLGGSQISANDAVIATTDGGSVHLYFENSPAAADENNKDVPVRVMLYDNFPDPFNASTTIQFELSANSNVELAVYNILGQKVKVLADEYFSSGRHSIIWNGLDQNGFESASGVYFFRLSSGGRVVSRKMLLLK